MPDNSPSNTLEMKRSFSKVTGPNLDGKMSDNEKALILESQRLIYKQSIKERRVEVVRIHGAVFSSKGPFFSGWISGVDGHWGVVVDNKLHHLRFKLGLNCEPVGVIFEQVPFDKEWVNDKRATVEDIGSTTMPLTAIDAIGYALILEFQDYRKLYRNCQTFAEIFIELICDIEHKPLSSTSAGKIMSTILIAFPLTTVGGSVVHLALKRSKSKMAERTKKALSWEDVVDAEITEELERIELKIEQDRPRRPSPRPSIVSDIKKLLSKRH